MSQTILVVDDAAFMRVMLRDILEGEGYVVVEAVNGRDAAEKYEEVQPDLVTMDIAMPEVDGLTALMAIRALDPGARVVIVSAIDNAAVKTEALENGAVEYVTKPFQPRRVVDVVRRCVRTLPN